ncbi:hypothetical protein HKCCE2091_15310 [Rhodobacterales bacterium HKCCE2091]|nr:hypothetical protein [Rhodobacterales bacterium HKCCE2091]
MQKNLRAAACCAVAHPAAARARITPGFDSPIAASGDGRGPVDDVADLLVANTISGAVAATWEGEAATNRVAPRARLAEKAPGNPVGRVGSSRMDTVGQHAFFERAVGGEILPGFDTRPTEVAPHIAGTARW